MKKKKSKMKKRLSLLIATVLAAGVAVPALVKSVTEVKADTTEPSVQYFAEANELEQLKGRQDVRLKFGKQTNNRDAEWYIVGKDGTDLALFSAQSYGSTRYQEDWPIENKIHLLRDNGHYQDWPPEGDSSIKPDQAKYDEVYVNHYGASTLREKLIGLASSNFGDVSDFMLSTTLQLTDNFNPEPTGGEQYSVSDKLYVPTIGSDGKLYFGKGASLTMQVDKPANMWTYEQRPSTFAKANVYKIELDASSNIITDNVSTDVGRDGPEAEIWPAFTLNITSGDVLFASVVNSNPGAGAAEIGGTDSVLSIRLDGRRRSGMDRTRVVYNENEIYYTNAPAGSSIIVQGKGIPNDNNKEWYWSGTSANGTIKSSDVTAAVLQACGTPDPDAPSINFTNCKIWLESGEHAGNLTYAIPAKSGGVEDVTVSGLDLVPESSFPTTAVCETEGIKGVNGYNVKWYDGADPVGDTVGYDKTYRGEILVTLEPGYFWKANPKASLTLGDGTLLAGTVEEILLGDPDYSADDTNRRRLVFEPKTEKNKKIEYEVLFDGEKVDANKPIDSFVYDGTEHELKVNPISGSSGTVEYCFAEDLEEANGWKNVSTLKFLDAGKYTVHFRIEPDNPDDHVALDTSELDEIYDKNRVRPIEVTIQPREVWIKPGDQTITWDYDYKIDQNTYGLVFMYDENKEGLLEGHAFKFDGDVFVGEEGAPILQDNIICEGSIYLRTEIEEGDVVKQILRVLDTKNGNVDVTHNYEILQVSPGKLTILHNQNLPPASITAEKSKTEYILGEALLTNDISVTATYDDGYMEKVSGYTTNEELLDMNTLGGKTLTVTFSKMITTDSGEESRSASTTLTINVVPEPVPPEEPDEPDEPVQGPPGEKGEPGEPGPPGPAGPAGPPGAGGNDGSSGADGSDGNNGADGSNGNNGADGSDGNSGADGSVGSKGNDGNNGADGSNGSSGANGSNGANGTSGGTNTRTNTSTTGSTNRTATTTSRLTAGARTGDTNPIAIWVLAALSSGIAVVSLMIFNLSRSGKKKKHKK